jgi:hypothetical protein
MRNRTRPITNRLHGVPTTLKKAFRNIKGPMTKRLHGICKDINQKHTESKTMSWITLSTYFDYRKCFLVHTCKVR